MLVWYDPVIVPPVDRTTLLVYGMWLSFALAAALITFFVARMAEQLRRQEQLQAQRREESMRDQQLLAVATQAAGAAHELGTPLATMSVLLKELRQDYKEPAELSEDLALLQSQVQLCKDSLRQLVRAAEADRRQAIVEQTRTRMGRVGVAALASDASGSHLSFPVSGQRHSAAPDAPGGSGAIAAQPVEQRHRCQPGQPGHSSGLGRTVDQIDHPATTARVYRWRSPNRSAGRSSQPRARGLVLACS
jgi:hypothetical protein